MKLLVFAHTPPPHHGQSYMVQLMLDGLGGDCRQRPPGKPHPLGIECYHVNARFSRGLEDVGTFKSAKILLVFWFWIQALWCRFRYGVKNFYYVPAPGKRVAVYRDWLVMLLCRIFFKRVILHWHAAGLSQWLELETGSLARSLNYRLFRPVDLSIVISSFNQADGEKLRSHQIRVVHNGIPDPCPDFDRTLLAYRKQRSEQWQMALNGKAADAVTIKVLFLAHCTRQKGLFAAVEAVLEANRRLVARSLPLRFQLIAAGNFVTAAEQAEFTRMQEKPDMAEAVQHVGFVAGERKERLLREADLFLFPTCYLGENQPVNLIEAMAFGLPIITTRWRSLPEMFPANYAGLVADQNPLGLADILVQRVQGESGEKMRAHFLAHYTVEKFLSNLAEALRSAESTP
jgi:glycosyltransferase involved in cell wall biosynthesis